MSYPRLKNWWKKMVIFALFNAYILNLFTNNKVIDIIQ